MRIRDSEKHLQTEAPGKANNLIPHSKQRGNAALIKLHRCKAEGVKGPKKYQEHLIQVKLTSGALVKLCNTITFQHVVQSKKERAADKPCCACLDVMVTERMKT